MLITTCNPDSGAFAHILSGIRHAFEEAGSSAEPVRSDKVPEEFDLYLGCSGWKQLLPPKNKRRGRVGIHVNPYGEVKVGSVDGGPIIDEGRHEREWVLRQEPDFVYCYCSDTFKDRYYGYWKTRHGIPVVGLPAAADITIYRPQPQEKRFQCEIGWVGGHWTYKAVMLNQYLRPLFGRKCLIYGAMNSWGNGLSITDTEVPILFSSAKICPSVSEGHTVHHPIDVPERVYKIPAAGGFTIHTPSPAIPDMFGDAVPIASDPRHWLELVDYYLANEEARLERAAKQRSIVLERHTYFDRCAAVARALGEPSLEGALMEAKAKRIRGLGKEPMALPMD